MIILFRLVEKYISHQNHLDVFEDNILYQYKYEGPVFPRGRFQSVIWPHYIHFGVPNKHHQYKLQISEGGWQ